MLNLLFQFFLLLYWRYHNQMLYREPCFLFWGGAPMFLCSGPKKRSRALNGAFYYDNVNIKAEKNWNNRFNIAFFWKRLGFIFFWGGGGGGVGLSPKTGCNLSSEATPNFFWPIFFWLFACVILSTLSGLWLTWMAKKTSIEEFSPIFVVFFWF